MKILIDNRTKLNNEEIGIILDDLNYRGQKFKIETMVMKRYFKVLIVEGDK